MRSVEALVPCFLGHTFRGVWLEEREYLVAGPEVRSQFDGSPELVVALADGRNIRTVRQKQLNDVHVCVGRHTPGVARPNSPMKRRPAVLVGLVDQVLCPGQDELDEVDAACPDRQMQSCLPSLVFQSEISSNIHDELDVLDRPHGRVVDGSATKVVREVLVFDLVKYELNPFDGAAEDGQV